MQNIKFNYLYRDAGNYKTYHSIVFENKEGMNLTFIEEAIRKQLIDEEYFIPQKWEVPLINEYIYDTDLDHDFYEFVSVEYTDDPVSEQDDIMYFLVFISK